jgi:alpha-mannosidase
LVTGAVTGHVGASNKNTFSLLSFSNPNIILWSAKSSEEGIENGLITRLWNMKNTAQTTTLKLNNPIVEAWQTTHIETNEKKLIPSADELKVGFKQNQIKTFRIVVKK